MSRIFLVLLMAIAASAQMTEISGQRIRAHVKFLSSDLLEGRGVGARVVGIWRRRYRRNGAGGGQAGGG